MNKYEMVALIVLIVVIGGVLRHAIGPISGIFKNHLKEHPLNGDRTKHQKEIDQQHIKQLEQRIEVLEAIVTSDGYDLKQHFKDLDSKQQETN